MQSLTLIGSTSLNHIQTWLQVCTIKFWWLKKFGEAVALEGLRSANINCAGK